MNMFSGHLYSNGAETLLFQLHLDLLPKKNLFRLRNKGVSYSSWLSFGRILLILAE